MKSKGGIILIILIASFAFIQLWQVEKNQDTGNNPNDFLEQNPSMPEPMAEIIARACYDCHSNHTNYPWYAHVAPFSWIIDQHIVNGKAELNFSQYGSLSSKQKIGVLSSVCDVIIDSLMPPANYLILHRDAQIDAETAISICDWSDEAALKIMRNR